MIRSPAYCSVLFALVSAGRLCAQVSVTPDNGSLTVIANTTGQTAWFTMVNTSGSNHTYYIFCYPSGVVTSCSPQQSTYTNIPPNRDISVPATFAVGAIGTGVVQLKACADTSSCTGALDYGNYNVTTVAAGIAVAGLRDTAPPQAANTAGFTTQFTVTNRASATETLTLTCPTGGSSTNISCTNVNPSVVTLAVGGSTTTTVTYSTVAAGWGWLTLTATLGAASASDIAGVNVVSYPVAVTPDARNVGVLQSVVGRTQSFSVLNVTAASQTYTFSVLCTGTAVSSCSTPASQAVPAGSAATVNVTYNSSATLGDTGHVRLQASSTPGQDTGWVKVIVGSQSAPSAVDITGTSPGSLLEPQICVTVAATRGAAYQCGDLRIVHPLPTTRTMNRARTPILIYNSQHAHLYPLIAANVSLSASAATPDSVVATLLISPSNAVHGKFKWNGADWIPGRASRIVVADTTLTRAVPLKDTIYSYTLQVVNWYGNTNTTPATATGTFAVVDRSASPFGAGWWLAGLEHLDVNSKIWTGGDGAVRQYRSVGTNVWSTDSLDRPDTLKLAGAYYLRILPHGDTVKFDATTGRHYYTVNRLGQQTSFVYDGCGRLQTITLPPSGSSRTYTFTYASPTDCTTKLQSVTSPPIGATARTTTLTVTNRRVTQIRDPDNSTVGFSYGTGADTNRIVTRTDRRGTVTTFTYDAGKKIAKGSIANGTGQPAITTRFRALQSYGIAGVGTPAAIDTAGAYTRLDGPRIDVGDTTLFWETKFFTPYRIMNALGYQTRLDYADSTPGTGRHPRWRALVTHLVYPNGRALGAKYDARGNLDTLVDSSVFQNGQYAMTRYVWNMKWDFDSIMVRPELDSIVMSYDPNSGNRIWQQDGRGSSSRTNFNYYSTGSGTGLLRSITTPLQSSSSPYRDSVVYDAVGNIASMKTPHGYWTFYSKDGVGRDTLIRSPTLDTVDLVHMHNPPDSLTWLRQYLTYDIADRVTQSRTFSPVHHYKNPIANYADSSTKAESLWVATYYNPEGLADSVRRWILPNLNSVNTLTTKWTYDPAGRRVKETAPDGAADSTVYDAAGNVVNSVTRRGHTIVLTYDNLNRLTRRTTPTVTYPVWAPTASGPGSDIFYFPGYCDDGTGALKAPNHGVCGLTIKADTEKFTYDTVGNLVTADNAAARIRRHYNKNGTLAYDTLKTLPYVGTDTTVHVYGLAYTYDRDGRRTSLTIPDSLAPYVQGVRKTQSYLYDRTTGLLDTVTDVLGYDYVYTYDLENRITQLDRAKLGANGVPEVRETYQYDAEGRDSVRMQYLGSGPGAPLIHGDTLLVYDARAKVTLAQTNADSTTLTYTGLGALAWSSGTQRAGCYCNPERRSERHVPDPLGNMYEDTHFFPPGAGVDLTGYTFYPTTGRLQQMWHTDQRGNPHTAEYNKTYDAAGNIYQADSWDYPADVERLVDRTASFYDAAGRLRLQDRRTCLDPVSLNNCDPAVYPAYNNRSAFEEFRYDALGRRILVRTRTEFTCYLNCRNAITRFVWDGNQILYEISSRGGTLASYMDLEKDTGQVMVQSDTNYAPYGRVLYTHGFGLDDPLGIVRMDFTNIFPEPILVLPLTTWNGAYDVGTVLSSLSYPPANNYCRQGGAYCMEIDWPAPYLWKTFSSRTRAGPKSWMGSLIESGRDNSGQYYRRNRYYDPATGRFTQEDPIGLAGGVNLYGFASGDPVNFSDPFGLCKPGVKAVRAYEAPHRTTVIECADKTEEVRQGGTIAWRNNNPGNLRSAETQVGTVGGFAVFNN